MTVQHMVMQNSDLPESNEYIQLWLAVVALAVDDALSPVPEIPPTSRANVCYSEDQWAQRRARLWLQSDESTVGSLNWICTMLNLRPEGVRDEFKRRLQARAAGERQDGHRDWRDEDRVSLLKREDRAAPDASGSPTNTA